MKKLFIPFMMAATCICFVACTPKPIDIDVAPAKPKLVVASQIIPNKIIIVALSKSFSALSNPTNNGNDSVSQNFLDSILVEHAFVTVSYMNTTDTLFKIASGIYASVNTLQYDHGTYTLYAKDSVTGEEIHASSVLLPLVPFDTVYPVIDKTTIDSLVSVKFEFTDNPNEKNWYVINYILKKQSGTNFDINSYFSVGSNKILTEFRLLSDQTFENSKYSGQNKLQGVNPTDTLAVTISNISEGYYQFLTAYKRTGNIFNQITGEPINYPSNVINGYGYFNTHYPSVHIFDLKNY